MKRLSVLLSMLLVGAMIAPPVVRAADDAQATIEALQTQVATLSGTPTASGGDSLTIHGTITATGRYIFTWLDDDLCALSFWDYDFSPALIVVDGNGAEVASVAVDTLPGTVTMEGPVGDQHAEICTVPYEVVLTPDEVSRLAAGIVQVTLDPYFDSGPLTASDLIEGGGELNIAFERQATDPGPDFRHRPGGAIIGTDQYRMQGIVEVPTDSPGSTVMATPFGCVTTGGYQDISVGTQLKITDETGTIIAIAELEPLYVPDDELCAFVFTADVPSANFYTVELGRRGDVTYSKEDLDRLEWNIDLTIG